jgi:hypothetical protein
MKKIAVTLSGNIVEPGITKQDIVEEITLALNARGVLLDSILIEEVTG